MFGIMLGRTVEQQNNKLEKTIRAMVDGTTFIKTLVELSYKNAAKKSNSFF